MRADQLLLQRQLATSRSQAQRLIGAGVRWRVASGADSPWKRISKNSDDVPDDAQIELLDASEARYVSRGGLKLEGALLASGVKVEGKTCLDVGQSTGGLPTACCGTVPNWWSAWTWARANCILPCANTRKCWRWSTSTRGNLLLLI